MADLRRHPVHRFPAVRFFLAATVAAHFLNKIGQGLAWWP